MKFSGTLRVDLNTVSFRLPVVKKGATKFMYEYNTAKLRLVKPAKRAKIKSRRTFRIMTFLTKQWATATAGP